jgi:hypothetical protein
MQCHLQIPSSREIFTRTAGNGLLWLRLEDKQNITAMPTNRLTISLLCWLWMVLVIGSWERNNNDIGAELLLISHNLLILLQIQIFSSYVCCSLLKQMFQVYANSLKGPSLPPLSLSHAP